MKTFLRKAAFVLLLPLLAAMSGCQTLRAIEEDATYLTIPPESETQLGQQYHEQITEEFELIQDEMVQQWLNQMIDELVAHSPETQQTVRGYVTTSPDVNAFAIPGGFLYVHTGLILEAENEAQVAAVVAHEINHITPRHGARALQRQLGLQTIQSALSSDATGAALVNLVSNAGGLVAMRQFSQHDERQADRLGVEAMYKAGYDPRQAAEFFRTLQRLQGEAPGGVAGFVSELTSSHPETQERINNIETQIQNYDLNQDLIVNTPRFEEVREILRRKVTEPEKSATAL